MGNKRILFLYPGTANSPSICNAIAILTGIAKNLSWDMDYFDTYIYEKKRDSIQDRESSGEFKFSERLALVKFKPFDKLVSDLQDKIDTFKPKIIAISCMSFEYEFLLTFFRNIQVSKETLIVIGGVHPTLKPVEVINSGLFDIVCVG